MLLMGARNVLGGTFRQMKEWSLRMAIYHLQCKYVKKSDDRSPVAMAAYRAGVKLVEDILDRGGCKVGEIIHDYRRRKDVAYNEVMLPGFAPSWMGDREKLWNHIVALESSKITKNAVYLVDMDAAIPIELNRSEAICLVRQYLKDCFVSRGMIVDVAIHWNDENPHVHVMTSMRDVLEGGVFGSKNRHWHYISGLHFKRRMWADSVNNHLKDLGIEGRVDHRSYKEQNIDLIPQVHEGVASRAIADKTGSSEMMQKNELIKMENLRRMIVSPDLVKQLLKARQLRENRENALKVMRRFVGNENLAEVLKMLENFGE